MNIPKNHKAWKRNVYLYFYRSDFAASISQIENAFDEAIASGVLEPVLTGEMDYAYGDQSFEWFIEGYVPMTEKEIEKAEAKRKAENARKKSEKEKRNEAEKKELKRLAKKFKVKVDIP